MSTILTQTLARLLFAPVCLIALAVLVKGYAEVGDGFSAGVIVALGILLQYLAYGRAETEAMLPIRMLPGLTFVGLLIALGVAMLPLLMGDPLLTHMPGADEDVATIGTLELITAVAYDIGIFVLVVGAVVGIIHTIALLAEEQDDDGEEEDAS